MANNPKKVSASFDTKKKHTRAYLQRCDREFAKFFNVQKASFADAIDLASDASVEIQKQESTGDLVQDRIRPE